MMQLDLREVRLPAWARQFEPPSRYKVCHGGRAAGRSWTFSRKLILRCLEQPTRALCCRELLYTIRDSVHQLLVDQIEEMGVTHMWKITDNTLRTADGYSYPIYRGLRGNAQEIKSLEGIQICWVEEGQSVSEDSWKWLIPTIREPDSEIWITMNRHLLTDPTDLRFIQNPPPNAIVAHINYDQNPWFPEVLKQEMEHDRTVDFDRYRHIWLGEPVLHTDAMVLAGKVFCEEFTPGIDWDGPYFGADWGYSIDPTAVTKSWIYGRNLYIEHEAWGRQVDMDALPGLFDTVPDIRRHTIRGDKSRPETIAWMVKHGFNVQPAIQAPGSVEDGISQLRGFERIIVHPRLSLIHI